MLVDFLIAGAQKCGTSALDHFLRSHPCVRMAKRKEVHFFDQDHLFETRDLRGGYAWYHGFFPPASVNHRVGESTPSYLYWKEAPARIQAYNPLMQVIVVLRNPVDRAFSHWNMARRRGWEPLPFPEALAAEKERLAREDPALTRRHSYVDRGFYSRQIERLWRFIPRGQSLVIRHDDLRSSPSATLAGVCRFLGLEPLKDYGHREVHTTPYERGMSAGEREGLKQIFLPEIRTLEGMFGWDLGSWLE